MKSLESTYAQALFECTRDEAGFQRDVELLISTEPLWNALVNPTVSREEKKELVADFLEHQTAPECLRFYQLLCEKGRISLLPAIAREYHLLCLEAENGAQAELVSASPMGERERERLQEALCRLQGKSRVELTVKEDPALLGGFLVNMGKHSYDRSVKGMLRALHDSLKER